MAYKEIYNMIESAGVTAQNLSERLANPDKQYEF